MDVVFANKEATRSGDQISGFRARTRVGSFQRFRRWCVARGLASLPSDPEVVARFAHELSLEVSSDELRSLLCAVRRTHLVLGLADPCAAPDTEVARVVSPKKLVRPSPATPAIASIAERDNVSSSGLVDDPDEPSATS